MCVCSAIDAKSIDWARLHQLRPVDSISNGVSGEEEIGNEHPKAAAVESDVPRAEESAAAYEELAVTSDVAQAILPSYSEQLEDRLVVAEAEASQSDPTGTHEQEPETSVSPHGISSTSYTTETVAASASPAAVFDPYSSRPSTPGKHPDPIEQEIPEAVVSTGDRDSEEKAEGGEPISVVFSRDDASDGDEMELQYPSEPDVNTNTTGEAETAESVGTADDISDESETDADGDDDPDYEDTSSASSVVGQLDVEQDADDKVGEPATEAADDPLGSPAHASVQVDGEVMFENHSGYVSSSLFRLLLIAERAGLAERLT
jgi:hypothetical protein